MEKLEILSFVLIVLVIVNLVLVFSGSLVIKKADRYRKAALEFYSKAERDFIDAEMKKLEAEKILKEARERVEIFVRCEGEREKE